MMVESVYRSTGDKVWLRRVYAGLHKEYQFRMTRRLTPCGLNRYSSEGTSADKERRFSVLGKRLGGEFRQRTATLSPAEKLQIGSHHLAEAESGWDFTPRFQMRCEDFCPIDLNANLYYDERNFEFFARELDLGEAEIMAWGAWRRSAGSLSAAIAGVRKPDSILTAIS